MGEARRFYSHASDRIVPRASAVSYLPTIGASRWLVVAVALVLWSGCSLLQPLQSSSMGDLGYFEFRDADPASGGVVVGAPHGSAEAGAIDFANSIRDRLGASLIIAHNFRSKRIPVERPLVYSSPIVWRTSNGAPRGSAYPEFVKIINSTISGPLEFYVGVRVAEDASVAPRMEAATAGLSFEQVKLLELAYTRIRDRLSENLPLSKVDIALNPLDDISWNVSGVKYHGVLMLANKGLILRLPKSLTTSPYRALYREIVAEWVGEAAMMARNGPVNFPAVASQKLPYGRIDTIASKKNLRGIVLAAPHGSFDWYTSDLVEEMSYRTSLPAVLTRGFTPTECGGWRINVNRPTERRYPNDTIERVTERSKDVYSKFSQTVFKMSRGPLKLYVEMHQNGTEDAIEVATVGITREQARAIKSAYQDIRDRVLRDRPETAKVELLIEPLDQVAIGAWAAKEQGVLRFARSSLHFELPVQRLFYRDKSRRAYTRIFAELIARIAKSQVNEVQTANLTRGLAGTGD